MRVVQLEIGDQETIRRQYEQPRGRRKKKRIGWKAPEGGLDHGGPTIQRVGMNQTREIDLQLNCSRIVVRFAVDGRVCSGLDRICQGALWSRIPRIWLAAFASDPVSKK